MKVKRFLHQTLCALLTIILISAFGLCGYTQDSEAAGAVLIENAENVHIDAGVSCNVIVSAYDEDIALSVDTRGAANGYITVSYDDSFTVKAKVLILKDGKQYLYSINSGTANLPLQMGDGVYTVILYKTVEGAKFKRLTEITLEVNNFQEKVVYTNSIQMVDYKGYKDVVDKINKLLVNAKSDEEKVKIIYTHITANFKYSSEKAEKVQYTTAYLPDLRDFANSGKGICYDFASLFAAVLRSNDIPTKLVMGYRTDVNKYHAWNEVLLDSKWVSIDTTYGAGLVQAGKKTDMIQDSSLYNKMKEY